MPYILPYTVSDVDPWALGVDLEVSRFQELQNFRAMGNAVNRTSRSLRRVLIADARRKIYQLRGGRGTSSYVRDFGVHLRPPARLPSPVLPRPRTSVLARLPLAGVRMPVGCMRGSARTTCAWRGGPRHGRCIGSTTEAAGGNPLRLARAPSQATGSLVARSNPRDDDLSAWIDNPIA